jgi:4-hydroxybenzoate polyprenyltransferase
VSVKQAWAFAVALGLIGFFILLIFNRFAILLGASSLLLVVWYPFMKRITWWPQAWLGLTFNWGVLFGYAAETGSLSLPAYLFYAGCFFWTMGYDTIYAHQDKEDDARIGVKSSALALGERTRPFLFIFYAAALALWASAGTSAGLGVLFWAGLAGAGWQLYWQAAHVNVDDAADCLAKFRSNRVPGWLLLIGIVAGHFA